MPWGEINPPNSTLQVGFASHYPVDTVRCKYSNVGLWFLLVEQFLKMHNSIQVRKKTMSMLITFEQTCFCLF